MRRHALVPIAVSIAVMRFSLHNTDCRVVGALRFSLLITINRTSLPASLWRLLFAIEFAPHIDVREVQELAFSFQVGERVHRLESYEARLKRTKQLAIHNFSIDSSSPSIQSGTDLYHHFSTTITTVALYKESHFLVYCLLT